MQCIVAALISAVHNGEASHGLLALRGPWYPGDLVTLTTLRETFLAALFLIKVTAMQHFTHATSQLVCCVMAKARATHCHNVKFSQFITQPLRRLSFLQCKQLRLMIHLCQIDSGAHSHSD